MPVRTLSAGDWLVAYEQLPHQPAWLWPAALIALGYDGMSLDDAMALPLPYREGLLLQLRRRHFGNEMHGRSICPACGSENEITLDCQELASAFPAWEGQPPPSTTTVELPSGASAVLAPLTAWDWAEASRLPSRQAALLLQDNGVKAIRSQGIEVAWDGLEEADQTALAQALENLNGGLRLEVICAMCRHKENREIDLGLWLAQEVSRAAQGILREVDCLARAYGWSERAILELSPLRRRLYLEMVA
jgi:hypothetical protein